MELPTYFADFLTDIRLTKAMVSDLKTGHSTLRKRLEADEKLAPHVVTTFLQGSYRRATAVRPCEGKRADVDTIVVTNLNESDHTPAQVSKLFKPFLDKWYPGKWKLQGRSLGIELSYVSLDLVPTSAPSEAEKNALVESRNFDGTLEDLDHGIPNSILTLEARAEAAWKQSPLRIPDRDANAWESTHPLEQIRWTWKKNSDCNTHYVNVVKSLKWWRRLRVSVPERPKGYPVEHLIGLSCPDGIGSVAAGVTRTLEDMATRYAGYAAGKNTPFLPDHGVPENNVLKRISGKDFALFHEQICSAAKLARRALDSDDLTESAELWRELFGDRFPAPRTARSFTQRESPTIIGGGRFA